MQMNQMIEITSEIVPNSSLTFKILRLHRIVVHREFGPDEAKSARQLDAFHKLLYRTSAPVPPKENRGCQLL
jgi:hypothetical protein